MSETHVYKGPSRIPRSTIFALILSSLTINACSPPRNNTTGTETTNNPNNSSDTWETTEGLGGTGTSDTSTGNESSGNEVTDSQSGTDGFSGTSAPDMGIQGPVCGDGMVEGQEVCDEGENNGSGQGHCVEDCTGLQTCGDGKVEGTEECETNHPIQNVCNATCEREATLAFISPKEMTGNLGGIKGANALCQAWAEEANIATPGWVWAAWLGGIAGVEKSVFERIPSLSDGYEGLKIIVSNSTVLASNPGVLLNDVGLATALNIMPNGAQVPNSGNSNVWTGLSENGTPTANPNCSPGEGDFPKSWISDSQNYLGGFGDADWTDKQWTAKDKTSCEKGMRIYCFETRPSQ